MFRINVSLILVVLLIQVHRSSNRNCAESINSVVTVPSCPTSKETWELAASKKHCKMHALIQNCTNVNNFIYHCVINHYGNATLEVCAPEQLIFGFCAEFNVDSGAIQIHRSAQCNRAFPKCDDIYVSSNAYKYPDCYQLVYHQRLINTTLIPVILDHTTSSPSKTNDRDIYVITWIYIAVVTASFCTVTLCIYCKRRHPSSKKDERTTPMVQNYGNSCAQLILILS